MANGNGDKNAELTPATRVKLSMRDIIGLSICMLAIEATALGIYNQLATRAELTNQRVEAINDLVQEIRQDRKELNRTIMELTRQVDRIAARVGDKK